ncbi:MAG: hypothetical protein ACFE9X_10395 [Promethearchaeota archaeon]
MNHIPIELGQTVKLAVRKDLVIPQEFTKKAAERSYCILYMGKEDGKFELCYLLNKMGLSLKSVENIIRHFREDPNLIDDLRDFAERNVEFNPNISKTSYYGIRYEDLKENYYLLKGYKTYYDSGAIGEDEDYEGTDFYIFFNNRIGDLEEPKTFFNGELIILECEFVGY